MKKQDGISAYLTPSVRFSELLAVRGTKVADVKFAHKEELLQLSCDIWMWIITEACMHKLQRIVPAVDNRLQNQNNFMIYVHRYHMYFQQYLSERSFSVSWLNISRLRNSTHILEVLNPCTRCFEPAHLSRKITKYQIIWEDRVQPLLRILGFNVGMQALRTCQGPFGDNCVKYHITLFWFGHMKSFRYVLFSRAWLFPFFQPG